jgi:hypothetical protein
MDDDDDDDDDDDLRVVIAKNRTAKRQAARFNRTTFLCDVMQRRSAKSNQRFEGSCCLYLREERRINVLRNLGIRLSNYTA